MLKEIAFFTCAVFLTFAAGKTTFYTNSGRYDAITRSQVYNITKSEYKSKHDHESDDYNDDDDTSYFFYYHRQEIPKTKRKPVAKPKSTGENMSTENPETNIEEPNLEAAESQQVASLLKTEITTSAIPETTEMGVTTHTASNTSTNVIKEKKETTTTGSEKIGNITEIPTNMVEEAKSKNKEKTTTTTIEPKEYTTKLVEKNKNANKNGTATDQTVNKETTKDVKENITEPSTEAPKKDASEIRNLETESQDNNTIKNIQAGADNSTPITSSTQEKDQIDSIIPAASETFISTVPENSTQDSQTVNKNEGDKKSFETTTTAAVVLGKTTIVPSNKNATKDTAQDITTEFTKENTTLEPLPMYEVYETFDDV